MTDKLRITGTA